MGANIRLTIDPLVHFFFFFCVLALIDGGNSILFENYTIAHDNENTMNMLHWSKWWIDFHFRFHQNNNNNKKKLHFINGYSESSVYRLQSLFNIEDWLRYFNFFLDFQCSLHMNEIGFFLYQILMFDVPLDALYQMLLESRAQLSKFT